jgi:hypothetical protein
MGTPIKLRRRAGGTSDPRVQQASSPAQAEPKRRTLGEGAAQAAPTAPHATLRLTRAARSGPERFWARGPVRVALVLCLFVSVIVHGSVVPLDVPHAFQVNDTEGEAAIPIDVISSDEMPSPPSAPNPPSRASSDDEKESAQAKSRETSARRDAGPNDAAFDAPVDAPNDGPADVDGAASLANADGGGGGRRDPEAIVGAASVRADVVLVRLVVNAGVIRRHPVGARMGYLLRGIPQWEEFMDGTDIDPIRDTDWVMILGPSLVNTSRDTVLIHYSVSDAVVDRAVGIVTRKYDRGGAFDAGVSGVRAWLARADRAERVILRPQPHLLAVVPPSVAEKNARVLLAARLADPAPGDAVSLRLVNPHHPMPEIPESVTELRMRVVPRADAGADVFVECDTPDADSASRAGEAFRRMIRLHNDAITSLLTHGLLDHVAVGTDTSTVKVHLTATRDQIETLVSLVGDILGVQPDEPPAPVGTQSAAPMPPPKPERPR